MRDSPTQRYTFAKHSVLPSFWISTRDSIQSSSFALPAKSVDRCEVTAEIGGSVLIPIEDSGHMVTVERPEPVNAALSAWMTGDLADLARGV